MKRTSRVTSLLSGLSALSLILSHASIFPSESGSWPGWRGPHRDGRLSTRNWPDRLQGAALERKWRVELGPSYSGPVVGDGRLFVTETRDSKKEVVTALELSSGKKLWESTWEGSMKVPFFAASNGSWIRATPALDGNHLYVAGMRDRLVCLDAEDGKIIWNVDFMERYGTPLPSFGFVSSPLVTGDAVYVQAGASFIKLEKKTGKTIWKSLEDGGGMFGSAFSSPVKANIAGRDQLVVQTRTTLAGVDPDGGTVLWSQKVPAFRGMNILTPVVHEDAVFTSSYGGGTFLFNIRKDGENEDEFKVTTGWKSPKEGYMSTPVVIGNHIYIHLRSRRLACFEWSTGNNRWISQERFGKYMSLVSQGNRILGLDQRGVLYLMEASPEKLRLVDSRRVAEQETWAHLAVSGEWLLVRELNVVSAFTWREEKPAVRP
jgi:outer membrane protein assembly factor BamB